MIKKIGSNYGGWTIDLDLIPEKSTIISAGLGNDISFDEELIRLKSCRIIGIDPTALTVKTIKKKKIEGKNYIYIKKGLYKDDNGFSMTDENTNGNTMFATKHKRKMPTVCLKTLFEKYENISVVKMNIEGAEYAVLDTVNQISIIHRPKQYCIRFHQRKEAVPFTIEDTEKCLKQFQKIGYRITYINEGNDKVDYEVLLC